MEKEVNTPTGRVLRDVHREVRVALLQEQGETKAALGKLSLSTAEKDKLIEVAEKTIGRRRTKFNWNQVFSVALKLLLAS